MKKALFLLIITLSLGGTELRAQNWNLFREYEFNSSPIDTNVWVNYYPTGHYWCNTMTWYQISRCHGTPITELATYWDNYVQYFNNGSKEGVKLIADTSYHKFENCVYYNYKSGMIYSKELFLLFNHVPNSGKSACGKSGNYDAPPTGKADRQRA